MYKKAIEDLEIEVQHMKTKIDFTQRAIDNKGDAEKIFTKQLERLRIDKYYVSEKLRSLKAEYKSVKAKKRASK